MTDETPKPKKFPVPHSLMAGGPGRCQDARGAFEESWRSGKGVPVMRSGLTSHSKQGVLRGFHFQRLNPRALIVRCVSGVIWDVVLDLRQGSPRYGSASTARLGDDAEALFIPPGYAHGFYAMTDAIVIYECSELFSPDSYAGINWKAVSSAWRGVIQGEPIVSDKDAALPMTVDPIEV